MTLFLSFPYSHGKECFMVIKSSFVEFTSNPRLSVMSLWTALMVLYLYCDFLTFFRPGTIQAILDGKMGFLDASPASLLSAAVLMAIPTLMIPASALIPARLSRILNLAASAAYLLVNFGNLMGETWAYYWLFGLLEISVVISIFFIAFRWPKERA
jgi:hypothetical protein